jgi:diacylglycerol kinase
MPRSWPEKFRSAWRGLWLAIRSERSFAVHLPMAAAVVVSAVVLQVTWVEACLLGLCVSLVLVAEIFNTAVEHLAREISRDERPGIAAALDMASGAVLLAAIGAACVGGAIFLTRLGLMLGWWKIA